MADSVPAIHVLLCPPRRLPAVDGRDKPGHDDAD
jgi:hypothetical protein